jgi:molybdate transport system substrate-binding protein
MRPAHRLAAALTLPLIVPLALGATGCGSDPERATGRLTVFAAASLTEAFGSLGRAYEDAHPGTTVTLSFGGSAALAQQVVAGAPADVFAAASPATMDTVVRAGAARGAPRVFARNRLVIAVPRGNPGKVATLRDLTRPRTRVALCAPHVPCGAAAAKALANAGVALTPATLEQDVRATLTKLRLGEVDAALVYHTDIASTGGEIEGVEFDGSIAVVNDYPIVALTDAPDPQGAAAFVEFVGSAPARAILTDAGFLPPPTPAA